MSRLRLGGRFHFGARGARRPPTRCGSAADRGKLILALEESFLTNKKSRVLVLNPGAPPRSLGSTPGMAPSGCAPSAHGDEEIERFRGKPMLARLDYRAELIEQALDGGRIRGRRVCRRGRPGRAAAAAALRHLSGG